ncbi:MAG: transcription antitermination factor NusB [Gammaproteobacteria bacterium CG22_combo_CG10-13_8_21_14_all_40_8]|nr:MAG: transcription antitermination factor NusB [Gammaproteobacteria bacterium CG22_combo_CG10-13_8_21_14_all_40_8]
MNDTSTNQPAKAVKMSPGARKKARQRVLQALYQWQLSGNALIDIENQFLQDNSWNKVDVLYFQELLHAIPQQVSQLDECLEIHMSRSMQSMDPVECAILRMATYELKCRLDVPYRVVINEAVDLAKLFGATDGHKFINGVVDKVAKDLRPLEFSQAAR